MKPKKPYKLKLSKLEYLSSVDAPAQGDGAKALLLKSADTFEMRAKVSKLDDALGLVFGYAFSTSLDGGKTPHVDYQNDAIDQDFLKCVTDFIEAGGKTDVNHDMADDGKIVYAWPLLPEINAAMGITSKAFGLAVAVKPSADTYAKFKAGELTGFSIFGSGIREPLEQAKRASAVAKASLYTDEVDGHQHEICVYEDGSFYVRYATSAGSDSEHSHGVVFENGQLTILANSGHTHVLAAGQPGIAVVPADAIVVVSPDTGVSMRAKSTRSPAMPHGGLTPEETMSNTPDIAKQLADVTKRNERLERIAKMSGAHKAHFDTLSGDDADAFLAKSNAEREAIVAEVAKRDEEANKIVYVSNSTGDVYKAKDDARLVEMAKRMDEQSSTIEKANVRKRAAECLGGMPGSDDVHDLILGSLLKSGAKQEAIDAALKALKGMKETSTLNKKAPGFGGTDPEQGDSLEQFNAAVAKFADKNGIKDLGAALEKYLGTDEGRIAKRKYDASRAYGRQSAPQA